MDITHVVAYLVHVAPKMNNSLFVALPSILLFSYACSQRAASPDIDTTINISLDEVARIEVDTTRMTRLEATDSSMLFDIDQLIINNNIYIVKSRNYLRAFDKSTGMFNNDVAQYGSRKSDFSNISMLWVNNDTILIFDCNRRVVLKHMPDGTFVGLSHPFRYTEIPADQPLREFYKMNDGTYLAVNGSTGGSTPRNPLLSLYSKTLSYMRPIEGRDVAESTYLTKGVLHDISHDRLLLWEPLRDTIFVADANVVRPLYAISWGSASIPDSIASKTILMERVKAFTNPDAPLYASFIRNVQTDEGFLYFSFADNQSNNYITRYNTNDGSVLTRTFASADGRYTQGAYFMLDGDSLRMALRDNERIEANPIIYTIAKSAL